MIYKRVRGEQCDLEWLVSERQGLGFTITSGSVSILDATGGVKVDGAAATVVGAVLSYTLDVVPGTYPVGTYCVVWSYVVGGKSYTEGAVLRVNAGV